MSTIAPVESTTRVTVFDWVPSRLHRLSLDEFEAMVASGVFGDKSPIYLINGFLAEKMTQNPPHNTADELCGAELVRVLPPGWYVRASKPVRLPPSSMPDPDRCVVRGGIRDYAHRDPGPADVGLAVEVADSSLDDDRLQAAIYGAAGIPIYWIVNVVDRQVEVYTGPTTSGYAHKEIYLPGQVVPVVLDGREGGRINVDSILP